MGLAKSEVTVMQRIKYRILHMSLLYLFCILKEYIIDHMEL